MEKGITRKELDSKLDLLNVYLRSANREPLKIHGAFGKVQLTNEQESKNVTHFLTINELYFYINAALDGMDLLKGVK